MKPLLGLLAVLLSGYVLLCGWLWLVQERLIYFPTPPPASGEHLWLGDAAAAQRIATRVRPGGAAVLYFGGNAEDVSYSVQELGAIFPDAAIYAPHYRGYGGSAGRPSEGALVADALALFDRVRADHADIAVIGRSLGSAVAVRLAAARPVQRLVLVTPFHELAGMAQHHFPYAPVRLLLRDRYDSERVAPGLRVPTTVLIAARDEVVPRWSSDRLVRALPPGTRVVVLPDADHNALGPGYAPALRGALP